MSGGFPSQRTSNAENVSILWRHHEIAYNDRYLDGLLLMLTIKLVLNASTKLLSGDDQKFMLEWMIIRVYQNTFVCLGRSMLWDYYMYWVAISFLDVGRNPPYMLSILRPRPEGRHFPDGIFKCIFLEWKCVNFDWGFTEVCSQGSN